MNPFTQQLEELASRAQNYRYGQAQQNLKELVEQLKKPVDTPGPK